MAASLSEPLLTVAIPTCNGAAHVAETVRSILSQADCAFELIVVDDRSEDDTLVVIRALTGDRARIELNSERLGLAGNWNRCVALASTPLISIFHQDDVMLPGHLSAHAASFADDGSLGLIASASMVIDDHGQVVPHTVVEQGGLGPIDRVVEPGQLAQSMAGGNPLRCSAVTVNAAAFRQVGGFDSSLRYVVDWDFWLRLSRTWRVAWLKTPTVLVRWHQASETHRFKTGMADLDESTRVLEQLFTVDLRDHSEAANCAAPPTIAWPGRFSIVRTTPFVPARQNLAKRPAKRDGMFAPPDQEHPERPPPFASNGDSGPRPAPGRVPLVRGKG